MSSIFYKHFILTVLVIGLLALPIANGGFVLSYLYSFFVLFIYIVFFNVERLGLHYSVFLFSFIIIVCLISSLVSFSKGEDVWILREYIRIPFLILLFFFSTSINVKYNNYYIPLGLALLVFFDFTFLYLLKDLAFSKMISEAVSMRGMAGYLEGYWRHIGIGGNPNFSAFIYSISIILGIHGLLRIQNNVVIKLVLIISVSLATFLLIITFSRTALVALLLSVFITFFRIKYIPILMLIIALVVSFLFINDGLMFQLIERFSSFSSFLNRVEMWKELLSSYGVAEVLVGGAFPIGVIDNDYLYHLYRFGIVVGILMLVLPWVSYMRIKNIHIRLVLLNIMLFYYISAFPGGTLTHPKTYVFFLLFINFMVSLDNAEKKKV